MSRLVTQSASTAESTALNWMVALALGLQPLSRYDYFREQVNIGRLTRREYRHLLSTNNDEMLVLDGAEAVALRNYSGEPEHLAWLIDTKRISVSAERDGGSVATRGWLASLGIPHFKAAGDTALIAALRCFVLSELGAKVRVPVSLVARPL